MKHYVGMPQASRYPVYDGQGNLVCVAVSALKADAICELLNDDGPSENMTDAVDSAIAMLESANKGDTADELRDVINGALAQLYGGLAVEAAA